MNRHAIEKHAGRSCHANDLYLLVDGERWTIYEQQAGACVLNYWPRTNRVRLRGRKTHTITGWVHAIWLAVNARDGREVPVKTPPPFWWNPMNPIGGAHETQTQITATPAGCRQ